MPMFSGLSAFPITPADETGRVDAQALGRVLDRLSDAGVDSIGLLGSTGSYPYLSRSERRRTIEIARETIGEAIPLLVGVGALATRDVIDLARDAEEAGTSALLLAPVSYLPLTDDEVFALFETVATTTDLPICVYNNPGTTHFTIRPELLGRLAEIETVVAAKNPSPPVDTVAAGHKNFESRVPTDFSLGYSVDWNAAEALIAGGQCWYSVAAGLFPAPCVTISRAIAAGDYDKARSLDKELEPLWALFQEFSSFRVTYAAAKHMGLTDAKPPLPVLPLSKEAEGKVVATLEKLAPVLG